MCIVGRRWVEICAVANKQGSLSLPHWVKMASCKKVDLCPENWQIEKQSQAHTLTLIRGKHCCKCIELLLIKKQTSCCN